MAGRRASSSAAVSACRRFKCFILSGRESTQLGNRKRLPRAFLAEDAFWPLRITSLVQIDDRATSITAGWFVGGRIGQLLKVVFVRAIPHVNFRREVGPAFQTVLPFPRMVLAVMISAEGQPTVIAMATVPRVGKHHIVVLVVANPLAATFRAREFALLATQSATGSITR